MTIKYTYSDICIESNGFKTPWMIVFQTVLINIELFLRLRWDFSWFHIYVSKILRSTRIVNSNIFENKTVISTEEVLQLYNV